MGGGSGVEGKGECASAALLGSRTLPTRHSSAQQREAMGPRGQLSFLDSGKRQTSDGVMVDEDIVDIEEQQLLDGASVRIVDT